MNKNKIYPIELKYKVLLEMVADDYEVSVDSVEAQVKTCIIQDRFKIMEIFEANLEEVKLNG
jgi:hypothetical protein